MARMIGPVVLTAPVAGWGAVGRLPVVCVFLLISYAIGPAVR